MNEPEMRRSCSLMTLIDSIMRLRRLVFIEALQRAVIERFETDEQWIEVGLLEQLQELGVFVNLQAAERETAKLDSFVDDAPEQASWHAPGCRRSNYPRT